MYKSPTSRVFSSYLYSLTCLAWDRRILKDPLVTQTARVKGRRDYRTSFCVALDSWMGNSSYFFHHRRGGVSSSISWSIYWSITWRFPCTSPLSKNFFVTLFMFPKVYMWLNVLQYIRICYILHEHAYTLISFPYASKAPFSYHLCLGYSVILC